MKRLIGVSVVFLSLICLTETTYLRQQKPGILSNQKMTNSAILAQNTESRSFAIVREPEGMVFDQTEQQQEIVENMNGQGESNQISENDQQYAQASESYYQDVPDKQEITQSTNDLMPEEQTKALETNPDQISQEGQIAQNELTQNLGSIEEPSFQLVEADNDPTVILKPSKISEISEQLDQEDQFPQKDKNIAKKEKKTKWMQKNDDDSKSLQPDTRDTQKMIITKIDDNLQQFSDMDDNEESTALQTLPTGISKEQFLAMMPVEQDLLINPIPNLESYQSANDIGNLGLSEADILKEMANSYDPPDLVQPEQISQ